MEHAEKECRPVPGFPDYMACSDGTIHNSRLNHTLKAHVRHGVMADTRSINLRKDGKTYHMGVKSLFEKAFPEWSD